MENVIELKVSSKRWQVLQPAIYLISILPGLVWLNLLPDITLRPYFFLTILAVVLIQHGINVLNDATDWKKGADSEKELSWVNFHNLDLKTVQIHGLVSFTLGTILGTTLVILFHKIEVLYLALPLVLLGFGYNWSQWTLSYTALGEWVTGLCYGPGVFGCMGYLFTGNITKIHILGSVAFAFFAVAVLFSHQPPQVLSDFLAGKRSFAVRFGPQKTILATKILYSISWVLLTYVMGQGQLESWLLFVFYSISLILFFKTIKLHPSPKTLLGSVLTLTTISLCLRLIGVVL